MPHRIDIAHSTFRVLFPAAKDLMAGIPIVHYLGPIGASIFFNVTDIFLSYLVLHTFWHALYCLTLPLRWTIRITIYLFTGLIGGICLFASLIILLFEICFGSFVVLAVLLMVMLLLNLCLNDDVNALQERQKEDKEPKVTKVEDGDEKTFQAKMRFNWKTGETRLEWKEGDVQHERFGLIPISELASVKAKYDADGTVPDHYLPLSLTPITMAPPPETLLSPFKAKVKPKPKFKNRNKKKNKTKTKKATQVCRTLCYEKDIPEGDFYSGSQESTTSTSESPMSSSNMENAGKGHQGPEYETPESSFYSEIGETPDNPKDDSGFLKGPKMVYDPCGLETPDGPIYYEGGLPQAPNLHRIAFAMHCARHYAEEYAERAEEEAARYRTLEAAKQRALDAASARANPGTPEGNYYSDGESTSGSLHVVTPAFVASPLETSTVLDDKRGDYKPYQSLEGSTLGLSE